VLWRRFQENVERRRHRLDYTGSALLGLGGTLLLLALLEGGVRWGWASPVSVALFVASAVLLAAFVLVERRAAEPVLPLWLLRHRVVVAAMVTSLVVGVLMMGLSTYVPLYAQSVLGYGAVASGFALAAMTLGWPIAASNSGRLYLTVGFRATMLIGGAIAAVGTALLLLVCPDSSILLLALPCFVMGLGFGLVASPSIIAAQTSVTWQDRGVATGSTMFARSVGSAVGVAIFGAFVNHEVAARLGRGVPDVSSLTPAILDPAIHHVFLTSAIIAVALLGVGMLMPKRVTEPDAPPGSS
jgi:predicted MFS family arabinose efflux permease